MHYEICTAKTAKEKNNYIYKSSANYILFCNNGIISDELKNKLDNLAKNENDKIAIYELRQYPFEHNKFYNPITCESVWASMHASLVNKKAALQVGVFDENVFEDIVDIDFSFKLRAAGYVIKYMPDLIIENNRNNEEINSDNAMSDQIILAKLISASYYLRLKFGGAFAADKWEKLFEEFKYNVQTTPEMEHVLMSRLNIVKKQKQKLLDYYNKINNPNFKADFNDFDSAFLKTGSHYKSIRCAEDIKFTVLIRAYKRTEHLKNTLESLTHQTYKNFDVIVVEDGENPVCKHICEAFEKRLNINYYAMQENAGRCKTGNKAASLCNTKYACFLDDDDFLFADYFEIVANAIKENNDANIFFSASVQAVCEDDANLKITRYWNNSRPNLTLNDILLENPVSIQAVVFDNKLFLKSGGFDEELDALEDWDIWIKLALQTDFVYINKALSLYRIPNDKAIQEKRNKNFDKYAPVMQYRINEYREQYNIKDEEKLSSIIDDNENINRLRNTAREINNSSKFKLFSVFRTLTNGKAKDVFGVNMPVDFNIATKQQCNYFIFTARTSKVWRFLSR